MFSKIVSRSTDCWNIFLWHFVGQLIIVTWWHFFSSCSIMTHCHPLGGTSLCRWSARLFRQSDLMSRTRMMTWISVSLSTSKRWALLMLHKFENHEAGRMAVCLLLSNLKRKSSLRGLLVMSGCFVLCSISSALGGCGSHSEVRSGWKGWVAWRMRWEPKQV